MSLKLILKLFTILVSLFAVVKGQSDDCKYKGKDYSIFRLPTDWTGTGGPYTYKFNFCGPTVSTYTGSDCVSGMVAYQLSGTFCTGNIALPTSPIWEDLDFGVKLTYNTGGRVCSGSNPSSWTVEFICVPDAPEVPSSQQVQVTETSPCNYEVSIQTSLSCNSGNDDENSDSDLSAGVIVTVVFVVLFVAAALFSIITRNQKISNNRLINGDPLSNNKKEATIFLWDCCKEPSTCALSLFCPCVVFGSNAEKVEGEGNCLLYCLGYFAFSFFGLHSCLQSYERSRIMDYVLIRDYNRPLNDDSISSCLLACACPACILAQEKYLLDIERGPLQGKSNATGNAINNNNGNYTQITQ